VTIRTHFTGFVSHVEPLPGTLGERTAVIHARGPEHEIHNHQVRLSPQVNVRADQVIASILDSLVLRRSKLNETWVLDVVNHMELGTNTRLAEPTISHSLETGKSTFAYIADTWGDGIPADTAIRELVESERGRFVINRDGQAVFYNRHHTLLDTISDATFTDNADSLAYTYGAEVVNQVQVRLTPRSIGPAGTVLWHLETAQPILPGDLNSCQIITRFCDENARPIGALSLIIPVPGFDYHANTAADSTGINQTSRMDVRILSADASAALLEIRNRGTQTLYLQAGMQLRGTPIYQGDPIILAQTDLASVVFHGLNVMSLDLPTLDSVEAADQLARYEVVRRKEARGLVRSIQVSAPLTQVLSRTLFDRITVQETQTDHVADYFIVAEEHEVDLGGARHRVTWLLESVNTFWIVGDSHLDQTTILAY
jgi:hypothetical protein